MRARPGGTVWPEQRGFELRDGERIEIRVEAGVARLLERGREAVIDERGTADVAERRGEQRLPRLVPHALVSCPADEQIAFLELVREREEFL